MLPDGVIHDRNHLVLLPARIMADLNLPDNAADSWREQPFPPATERMRPHWAVSGAPVGTSATRTELGTITTDKSRVSGDPAEEHVWKQNAELNTHVSALSR